MPHRAAIAGLIVALTALSAHAQDRVGDLGEAAKLDFGGDPPASADRLRAVLGGDPDVQAAAEPDGPLADYLDTLDQRLRVGLMTVGYPRPDVAVTAGDGHVRVTFAPGPRRRAGPVKVDGDVAGLDVAALVHALTTPLPNTPGAAFDVDADGRRWVVHHTRHDPPPTGALPAADWTPGDGWATFSAFDADQLTNRATAVLATLGRFRPRLSATVEDDGTSGVLHVHVRDLGPAATVAVVTVTGTKANTPAAVVELLGLKVGQRLDTAAVLAAQQRLWDSGRFAKHTITVQADSDTGNATITVDMDEADLPPIGTPFTPEEQVMLRLRQWLLASLAPAGGRVLAAEAVVSDPNETVSDGSIVIGPKGIASRMRLRVATRGGRPVTIPVAFVGGPGRAAVAVLGDWPRAWANPAGGYQFVASLGAEGEDAAVTDHHFNMAMGANVKWGQNPDAPPVVFDLTLAPAFFVGLVHGKGVATDLRDGVLTVTSQPDPDRHTPRPPLRVRADTGELLPFEQRDGADRLAFRVAPTDALTAETAAIDAAIAKAPNVRDPDRPIASAASFALEQLARVGMVAAGADEPRAARAAAVVARLASPANLDAVRLPAGWDDRDGTFDLPPSPGDRSAGFVATRVPRFLLPAADSLFARGTWPMHLARSVALNVAGRPATAGTEMSFVQDNGGPLACLAVAELARRFGSHELQCVSGRAGLGRLSAAAFDHDLHDLLAPGSGSAAVAAKVVESIRQLTPADVDDLTAGLPSAIAQQVRVAIVAAKALAPLPGDQTAGRLLARAYDHGLRDVMDAELRRLAE